MARLASTRRRLALAILIFTLGLLLSPEVASGQRKPNKRSRSKTVNAALDWLVRHQRADGHWSGPGFMEQCADPDAPCKVQHPSYTDGKGFEGYDAALTGLAILAFLSDGHSHLKGKKKYRPVVARARDWLVARQEPSEKRELDGFIGRSKAEEAVYNHAIATVALAELLSTTRDEDPALRKAVERAVGYCLRARNEGYGWKYQFQDGKNDTSVTGWMIRAVLAGKECSEKKLIELDDEAVDAARKGALNWLNRATSRITGIVGYMAPGDEGSRLQSVYPEPYPYSKELSTMTAVGVASRLACGVSRSNKALQASAFHLVKHLPEWHAAAGKRKSTISFYYWYYATHALKKFGGKPWSAWRSKLKRAVIPAQSVGGCEDGSWDPVGEWGAAGGRVYATAMGILTLGEL